MLKKVLCGIIAGLMLLQTSFTVGAVDYGTEYKSQPNKVYAQKFKDVTESHWAFEYISEMSERGVLAGYPNGYFYPENNVTRAEFAKIMCLAGGIRIENIYLSEFEDVNTYDWFLPYVEAGKYYLSGYSTMGMKMYYPDDNALREDIAVALVKLKGYSTVGADESILKAMFTDWQSISTDGRKYVAVALENGLISGYEDNTFRGQNSITRAEAATLLWRAYQYGNENKIFDVAETEKPKVEVKQEQSVIAERTETPKPEKQKTYDYSIELNSSKLTVDEGEDASLKIVLTDEDPTGVDYSMFETNCEITEKEISGNKGTVTVKLNTDTPGKQDFTFSYKEKSKKFTLVVNEVQKYTWKVETIVSNVDFVHTKSYNDGSYDHSYNMVEAKDGVLYSDGMNVYLANGDKNKDIFCLDDFEWQGGETSKKDTLTQSIVGYAYNFNDDNIYAIINQRCGDYISILYNITKDEIICQFNPKSLGKILGFYSDGTVETTQGKILQNGTLIDENYSSYHNINWVYDNNLFLYEYNSCEGPFMWYELKKLDLSTNSFKDIDADTDDNFDVASCATGCLYVLRNKTISKLDTNGDSEDMLSFEQVRVDDGKKISSFGGMVVDLEENIYFYDDDYKCIRKISRI